ncbi:MAG: phosphate signaling complex protein PhoU [Verrucomicrobia bacterium]|nr:phosphate signaling complex protein PhoU [Verrucomicrobiota bacterium]
MPDRGKHIQSSFDAALNSLKNDVLMMSSLTERVFDNAMEGLLKRDTDLSNQTVADDEEIDALEKEIDRAGVELLIRFQPVASDMRRVISTMKLSTNLERVADQAVAIARRTRKLNLEPAVPEVALIEPLFREAKSMLRDSLHAFVEGDVQLALTLKPRDRYLDQLNSELNEELAVKMAEQPSLIRVYLNLIFVARALERIGDHATNIAEDSIWVEQAEDIRHTYGPKPVAG